MTVYVISDTHFNHKNILNMSPDPRFESIQDRNEFIVASWNQVVQPEDHVYHLGDFGFGNQQELKEIYGRLAGHKRLVVGNHDSFQFCMYLFEKVMFWKKFYGDKTLLLTHVPVSIQQFTENPSKPIHRNIHGHTHLLGSPEGPYSSVCVELTNYTPVKLDSFL